MDKNEKIAKKKRTYSGRENGKSNHGGISAEND